MGDFTTADPRRHKIMLDKRGVAMNVGFVEIGQLGGRMAERLVDGGYHLVVHDIRREAATRLLEKGAAWADTPREVAQVCRVVISSLACPARCGAGGPRHGWAQGRLERRGHLCRHDNQLSYDDKANSRVCQGHGCSFMAVHVFLKTGFQCSE